MLRAQGLEYESYGNGEPVLLMHGCHLADALLPLTREAALTRRYRLIHYHRRGFVGSDPHSGGFSIEQQAQDATALVTHLGLDRVHLLGQGYGALIAVQLALDVPSVVRSMVLLEPPLMTVEETAAFADASAPLYELYRSGDIPGAVDASMSMLCGPDWRDEIATTVAGGAEQAEKDAPTFFDVEFPAMTRWFFDAARAQRIAQPALFVSGSDSGPIFEAPRSHFRAAVPGSETMVLPGLNHLLQMRDPALVAAPIAEFLSRSPMRSATDAT